MLSRLLGDRLRPVLADYVYLAFAAELQPKMDAFILERFADRVLQVALIREMYAVWIVAVENEARWPNSFLLHPVKLE
jgi:hypothetical protein